MINVAVQGLGYVGCATALTIASKLSNDKKPIFNVYGIEKKNAKSKSLIDKINSNIFPHPTSDSSVKKYLYLAKRNKNFLASNNHKFYSKADVIIISINFDFKNSNFEKLEISSFKKSLLDIAKNIKENSLIIVQSTVPPGTTEKIVTPIIHDYVKKRGMNKKKIFISHSFERVMPGENYFNSITNNWRVYSGINKSSEKKCEIFLKKIVNIKKYPLTKLNCTKESEVCKLMENSYRAVNIAFIDEWMRFSDKLNLNLFEIINAIRKRPTHANIMLPGFGVGGYCIPKDPLIAKAAAKQVLNIKNLSFPMSLNAAKINRKMPDFTFSKIMKIVKKNRIKNILLMGVSYKNNIGDTRFSPTERLYKKLMKKKLKVFLHDPFVKQWKEINKFIKPKLPNMKMIEMIIFLVNHDEYKNINFKDFYKKNKRIFIFDANNVLSKKQTLIIKKLNFQTEFIGKK